MMYILDCGINWDIYYVTWTDKGFKSVCSMICEKRKLFKAEKWLKTQN